MLILVFVLLPTKILDKGKQLVLETLFNSVSLSNNNEMSKLLDDVLPFIAIIMPPSILGESHIVDAVDGKVTVELKMV